MDQRDIARYVGSGVPLDLATTGGLQADYVSMKNFNHIEIIVFKGAGSGSEDATLTITQASAIAGIGAKALTFTKYTKQEGADLTAIGTVTVVDQAAANTITLDGDSQGIYVIEFDASNLDAQNGFDCIKAGIADVGSTAQLAVILYRLSEPRYSSRDVNPMAD